MVNVIRVIHPLFCWGVFAFLGLEALENRHLLQILIVELGLAGLSQTYWRIHFQTASVKSTRDLISFSAGLLPAVIYPLVVLWHFVF